MLGDHFFCSVGFKVTFRGLGEIQGSIEEVFAPQSPRLDGSTDIPLGPQLEHSLAY